MRAREFILCPTLDPVTGRACVLVNGHTGEHSDGEGRAWELERPLCGAVHPYKRGLVCERPENHRGGHTDRNWWWQR